jgi:two-component system, NtrC family, sensor histidine kinase PilS
MRFTSDSKQFGWFLPLRLASFIVLFSVVVLWLKFPEQLQLPFVAYAVTTLLFALLLIIDRRQRFPVATAAILAAQFILEVVLEAGVLWATGSINSPFSGLFLLTIVSAALAFRLAGTLITASVVSISFCVVTWHDLSNTVEVPFPPNIFQTIITASDNVFYSVFLHLLIFYLVAFIAGYLAEHLVDRDRRLADTSRALRIARLETDDILRHLNSGLLTINPEGRITYFNRAAERILGYREEEVRGMLCHEVFADRMPGLVNCLLAGIVDSNEHPRREIDIINAEGRAVPVGLSTSILLEENGSPRGVIAIFSDLTRAKKLETKVRAADRLAAVGELSASIAHEIRNPLAAISGSVEVLSSELPLDGENARLMELIVKESTRLNTILTDFLNFARIDRPAYTKVELCHVIADVIKLLKHSNMTQETIDINFESDESMVYVVGDEDLLKQLLLNLGVNACQAMIPGGGELTFRLVANPERKAAELYVIDTGPGIPPDRLKRIFEPFYSTRKGGTGLGLAIVHRIANALELELACDSQVGEGTTFLVSFRTYSDRQQYPTTDDLAQTAEALASPPA